MLPLCTSTKQKCFRWFYVLSHHSEYKLALNGCRFIYPFNRLNCHVTQFSSLPRSFCCCCIHFHVWFGWALLSANIQLNLRLWNLSITLETYFADFQFTLHWVNCSYYVYIKVQYVVIHTMLSRFIVDYLNLLRRFAI